MDDHEKVQSFLELYKVQWGRYDKRRDFEWKVTLGLWTGIAAATGFLAGKVQMTELHLVIVIYGLIWVVYTFVWTAYGWRKNEEDKEYALGYLRKAELLLGHIKEDRNFREPGYWDFLSNWSRLSQVLTSAFLVILSLCVLTIVPVAEPDVGDQIKKKSEHVTFPSILSSSCTHTQINSWEYGMFTSFRSGGGDEPFAYWETADIAYTGRDVEELAERAGFNDYPRDKRFGDLPFINHLGSQGWELYCITDLKEWYGRERVGKEYFFKRRK